MTHRKGKSGKRGNQSLRNRQSCPFCSGPLIFRKASPRDAVAHGFMYGHPDMTCVGCSGVPEDLGGRSYSGPAWQTQKFQKQYQGPRIYGVLGEKVYETRGVAAIGGVRWVPPPAVPGQPYYGQSERRYSGPKGIAGIVQAPARGRKFGVPERSPGTSGWAGAGGIAQAPGPGCMRGARNKKGLKRGRGAAHAYGSLGYASMGDGSMDMATDPRRYGMTWLYDTCRYCGDSSEEIDGRRFSGSPELHDPFKKCVKIVDPFTGTVKEICSKPGGGTKGPAKLSADLKDPFKSTLGKSFKSRR